MTIHFLSFLLDLVSWLIFGAFYGRYIQIKFNANKKYIDIVTVKISLAALIGGLIAVLDRSLPEYGFSFYHLGFALFFAFAYSLTQLKILRSYGIKYFIFSVKYLSIIFIKIANQIGRKTQIAGADAPINV
jgi:hypothetical protein